VPGPILLLGARAGRGRRLITGVEGVLSPELVRSQVERALIQVEEHCCARKRAGLQLALDFEGADVDVHINFPNEYNFPILGTPICTALLMLADGTRPTGKSLLMGVCCVYPLLSRRRPRRLHLCLWSGSPPTDHLLPWCLGRGRQEVDSVGRLQPLEEMKADDLLVWAGEGITKVILPASAKTAYEAHRAELLGKKRGDPEQKETLKALAIEAWEKVHQGPTAQPHPEEIYRASRVVAEAKGAGGRAVCQVVWARALTITAGRGELRVVGSVREEFKESVSVAATWVKLNEAELKTRLGSTVNLSLNDSATDFILDIGMDKYSKDGTSVSPV
jgi:hypothetical protein